jgi:hypothetical protein
MVSSSKGKKERSFSRHWSCDLPKFGPVREGTLLQLPGILQTDNMIIILEGVISPQFKIELIAQILRVIVYGVAEATRP